MKNAPTLDGYIGWLAFEPFNAEYLKWRMQRSRLKANTPITLMAWLDRREPCQCDRERPRVRHALKTAGQRNTITLSALRGNHAIANERGTIWCTLQRICNVRGAKADEAAGILRAFDMPALVLGPANLFQQF